MKKLLLVLFLATGCGYETNLVDIDTEVDARRPQDECRWVTTDWLEERNVESYWVSSPAPVEEKHDNGQGRGHDDKCPQGHEVVNTTVTKYKILTWACPKTR